MTAFGAINSLKLKLKMRIDWRLLFGRGYLSWHRRPKKLEDWRKLPVVSSKADYSDVAIVMQGVVDRQDEFTFETLRIYQYFFPGAILILSTWSDTDSRMLDRARSLGVQVVVSEPIINPARGNFSRQVETSIQGIHVAKSSGAKFVLKVRTDQRLYSHLSLDGLLSLVMLFPPISSDRSLRGRIIFPSSNSFVDRILGATDFMQFGYLEDVQKMWTSSLRFEFTKDITPEQTITASYLLELGWEREGLFTSDTWIRAMREVFGFVDGASLDFFWHKYSMREYLWRSYGSAPLDEITQSYWLKIMADGKSL